MAHGETCFEDAPRILKTRMCLEALSKNLKGELELVHRDREKCGKPACRTLKTVHRLKVETRAHRPCDSALGKAFKGAIVVDRLVTAFDVDGEHRGFHSGELTWYGSGIVAVGELSGMTNVGTHRKPVFRACQKCHDPGFMEGRFCGEVIKSKVPELEGCHIFGTYRIRFDPSIGGGEGAIEGTLEGVVICPCRR